MSDKTVMFYKTHALGKTEFIFLSGDKDPLNIDSRDRRFCVVEGRKTVKAFGPLNGETAPVLPSNTEAQRPSAEGAKVALERLVGRDGG